MARFLSLFVLFIVHETSAHVQIDPSGVLKEEDENPRCKQWAVSGECSRNPKYMMSHCAMACFKTKDLNPTTQNEPITSQPILKGIKPALEKKLDMLLQETFTDECRHLIVDALEQHLVRNIEETTPFQHYYFTSQCPPMEKRTRKSIVAPPKSSDIRICFLLLIHDNAQQAIRLINSLQESLHSFIVHIDGKAPGTLAMDMSEYASTQSNVRILPPEVSVNISWGGYNMVKATLNGMAEALKMDFDFDWLCNLSGASYPLASNEAIRKKLSELDSRDTVMMEVNPQPTEPSEGTWHYFIECDNKLRRIGPLAPPRGIQMYTGSQWFFASKAFVRWLVEDKHLVERYTRYSAHTVVADENFFATMLKNSPFCHDHVNNNMLHVQFDQWEHDKFTHKLGKKNRDKCLMPNPDHCGRSPTVISIESLPVLELSDKLWARKFDSNVDASILDALDVIRTEDHQQGAHFKNVRAKLNLNGEEACLVIGGKHGDAVTLEACSSENVTKKVDDALEVGSCSSDGHVELSNSSKYMQLRKGRFSSPFCPIRSVSNGNCLDLEGESVESGTKLIGWSCSKKWNQLFSFGSGELTGAIFLNVPLVMYQDKRMCLEAVDAKLGSLVTVRDCDPGSLLQKFQFELLQVSE